MNMDCPFCAIDKEKNRIIKESKHAFVIFSNPRLMRGHLLVVPKRHVEKLSQLNDDERRDLFDLVMEFQDKISEKIAAGCDIRQNYRPFQKQSDLKVHHLHVHLQPRELNDELYEKCQIHETDIFSKLPDEELEDAWSMLN
ncbi:MAG: histidine triad (HIT) protein [uncultured bacterium]|nr:MAG: histidine triad (HIT) protein [uncultured bacterium]